MDTEERIITTSCSHNCGGRCILRVHVNNGRVTKVSTDNCDETAGDLQLRACERGRSCKERLYHPDRLKYPLKRVGRRGAGEFRRISWDEATSTIAGELDRITRKYGPEARYMHYSTGIGGLLGEREFFKRLLSICGGGFLNFHNSYSSACTKVATPYTFGTANTGSSRDNWLYSRLIILWGHNPAETIFGTNTIYYLKKAREKGAKIIVIDPRYSDSAVALADQWIPLLPTTDNALMDAMIFVMIEEELYDKDFVDRFCLGFDEEHMPGGIPTGNSLKSYILGQNDGIPKTPEWAEKITRVQAQTIRNLAREYATAKPAALLQGWGPQRHAFGEQPVRGATVLASITGNVGILGGWASGCGTYTQIQLAQLPYENKVKTSIPVFTWPEAVADGRIRFIASLAGNCLVNQHSDINSTVRLLEDDTKCEFILVSDEFMTSSARYADILLPSTNFLERTDIISPWEYRDYAIFQNKAVEPEYERRTGYDWMVEVASKLGAGEEFSQGKTYEEWARYIVEKTREVDKCFPTYEEFSAKGVYRKSIKEPVVAFKKQIEDFENNPFPTPSGKIEIFSERLFEMNKPEVIPAIPKYIPSWEGPSDPLKKEYPLQLISWHSKKSTHSTLSNSEWLSEAEPHVLWMNPEDAKARGLSDGDLVLVWNQRGRLTITLKVTVRIMQGVVAMPQGAWYRPDSKGVDRGGCINTLTKYQPTPLAKGNPQHTNLVQVEKYEEGEGEADE